MRKLQGLLIVGLLVFLTACGTTNTDNNNNDNNNNTTGGNQEANTNTGITKEQIIEGLKLEKTALVFENGSSTLTTQVTNTGSAAKYVGGLTITFKDKDGKVIATLDGYLGQTIQPGASTILTSSVSQSLMDATSVTYVLKK